MKAYPYEERNKNVFYQAPEFKARIIELPAEREKLICEMKPYVFFNVLQVSGDVMIDKQSIQLYAGQFLITELATISLQIENYARMVGV